MILGAPNFAHQAVKDTALRVEAKRTIHEGDPGKHGGWGRRPKMKLDEKGEEEVMIPQYNPAQTAA